MQSADPPLPDDVLDAVRRGKPLEALKRLRAATGLGWGDASKRLAEHLRDHPQDSGGDADHAARITQALVLADQLGGEREGDDTDRRGAFPQATRAARPAGAGAEVGGLAPGEVPRSGSAGRWIVVLAVVGLVGYAAFMALST